MDLKREIQALDFKIHRLQMKALFDGTDLKLHPQQVPMLFCVMSNEGCTQSFVAAKQEVSPATVGVSVRRLQKSGLLRVEQDKNDLRARRLYVTDEGRRMLERAKEFNDRLNRAKLAGFSDGELEVYFEALNRIYGNLKDFNKKGEQV